ncbi:MAG: EamA family transporter [Chloroflexi bacterium]|nr:EamA family transporter [Chloroflexota bacterium]
METSKLLRGSIYGITAASLWGSLYVVSDVTLLVVPPFTLMSARLTLALLVLLPLAWRRGIARLDSPVLLRMLAVGVLGIGISLGAQFVGTDMSNAVNGALVTSASPAFVVLFAIVILHERLTIWRFIAIALATTGVLAILDPASADFASDTFLGDLFLAFAALTWGLYSVLVRLLSLRYPQPTLTVTVFALLGGLLVSLPASALELSQRPVGSLDAGIVLGVLYLGLVCTAIALLLWNRAFALLPASAASLFFFAQPLSGAVLAAALLGQHMSASLWLGGLLIAGGVLLSLRAG